MDAGTPISAKHNQLKQESIMPNQNIIHLTRQIPKRIKNQVQQLAQGFPIDIEILETRYHQQDTIRMFPVFTAGEHLKINGFEVFDGNITYWLDGAAYAEEELPSFRVIN